MILGTLAKIALGRAKIPLWQRLLIGAGPLVAGYAASKFMEVLASRGGDDFAQKLKRLDRMREDKILSDEEYRIARRNLVEKYEKV